MVSIWGCNVNPFYSADRCNNGGGYWQPCGGCLYDVHGTSVVVEVDDLSCGDFGSRVGVVITDAEHQWSISYGTMSGADEDDDIDAVMASVSGCLGVYDPWASLVRPAMNAVDWAAWQTA